MRIKGEVTAALKMAATGSQIFTILLIFISGLSVLGSFFLIWAEKQNWDVFLWVAGVSGALAAGTWFMSRKDADLASGHATTIKLTDGEVTLSADPRLGTPAELLDKAANFAITLANRKALPVSNGLVDSNFNPIENSEEVANRTIVELNAMAKALLDQYSEKLGIKASQAIQVGKEVPVGLSQHEGPTA
ncbi:hypothetical protein KSS94_09935 [Pseudomonas fakonensis]|uniref:Uncharacterized protein n=1 Tax=Pseudomonas fakonensis TaxID=2842355 RepID=A0ABX8NAN6_9PSED|nr:hypothetical protein [Pseudomonas fakonensis]QXH53406.1 hypothetical protein KSS94_09935 [Pseudomonas fakonensis]